MERRPRRRVAYRKRNQNKFSMFLVTLVVITIMVVVAIQSASLKSKLEANNQQIEKISQEIEQENKRSEDIEELRKYMQTKGYIEEVAKEKLGLIYEGEILFKEED